MKDAIGPKVPGLPTDAVTWRADGHPHSARFGDIYHSRTGGVAQSAQVFLAGCGLPEGWAGRGTCTVLETGFGLGLNFLTAWAAWEADPQRCQTLYFVSVEAYPVTAADIVRNVAWQLGLAAPSPTGANLPALAEQLAQAWHGLTPGLHTRHFHGGRVVLTLAVGQVHELLEVLAGLRYQADAVYLDGFSPHTNPEMWSLPTLQATTRLCHAGTRLASYSTARAVREHLAQLGWQVQRRAGLPPKHHRLEAVLAPPGH